MIAQKDKGYVIRVPAEALAKLRKVAEKQARKSPLLTEAHALLRLCQRAIVLGADDPRLTQWDEWEG